MKCSKCNTDQKHCPKCGSCPKYHEVKDFDRMWGEGYVYCMICDAFVRHFDSG